MPGKISKPPFWRTYCGQLLYRHPSVAIALGRIESALLAIDMDDVAISRPIYINGLARSGSTILLELIASHPGTVSHRYKDFPIVLAPWWWRHANALALSKKQTPTERAHQDGIMVTPDSPEAMEELVWMAFFPHAHDPQYSAVLTEQASYPEFEAFYRRHIAKMLLLEKGTRYVAKGNYNITRLAYLHRLFADAVFLIPVRNPVTHIASLMRQQRLFSEAGKTSERVRMHLQASGHFEFGPDRRPINVGNQAVTEAVLEAWRNGEEAKGLALHWNDVYGHVLKQLSASPELQQASQVVRLETLREDTEPTIRCLLQHCQLEPDQAILQAFTERISRQKEAPPDLPSKDIETIIDITGETARQYGYTSLA